MELNKITEQFLGERASDFVLSPITNGHINTTYVVENSATGEKYILQKINTNIFKEPENLAHNHLEINKILSQYNYKRTLLKPLESLGHHYYEGEDKCWRMLEFIPDSKTFLKVPDPETAYKAAEALSEFYAVLNAHAEEINLSDPLPGFINFEKRINDYKISLENSAPELKEKASEEISFVNEHLELPNQWIEAEKSGNLKKRIIHADPKISNVLFNQNNEPLAVIDLDTVMYGTLLYDFGDMIRSYTNMTDEDDSSMTENFNPAIFEKVKEGFLSHLDGLMTSTEKEMMDYAAKAVIYIQAVRFLTDYLDGSKYYATKYPDHNLDRTKNQINLVKGLMKYLSEK